MILLKKIGNNINIENLFLELKYVTLYKPYLLII